MKRDEYQKYLQSTHWKERRKLAIEEAGSRCEKCGMPRWLARIAYPQDLNVHHLSYANLGKEQYEDLEVLCLRCHEMETFGRSDLKEPKYAKCSGCSCRHWNPYSDWCEPCGVIFGYEGEKSISDYFMMTSIATRRPFWEDLVGDIRSVVRREYGSAWELIARLVLLEKPANTVPQSNIQVVDDGDIDFDNPPF